MRWKVFYIMIQYSLRLHANSLYRLAASMSSTYLKSSLRRDYVKVMVVLLLVT